MFESGSGSDVANLTSPGRGSFYSLSTASILDVGMSTITVNTFLVSGGETIAVPGQIVMTGNSNGTDTATVYDSAGTNSLNAVGSDATLTTASQCSVAIDNFGSILAVQNIGKSDTIHASAIDFALSTVGKWTND